MVSKADAHDLFFNLHDFENYSAIDQNRLLGLQESLQTDQGVDIITMPTVLARQGLRANLSIGNSNESTLSLGLQADPEVKNGGYVLNPEPQRHEP